MTEMTFSAQAIIESEKAKSWQAGGSVLHMLAQRDVAVIWKYVHFKPDDIRQAPNHDNYAWDISTGTGSALLMMKDNGWIAEIRKQWKGHCKYRVTILVDIVDLKRQID